MRWRESSSAAFQNDVGKALQISMSVIFSLVKFLCPIRYGALGVAAYTKSAHLPALQLISALNFST